MKRELDLVREQLRVLNLPRRDTPPRLAPADELLVRRRLVRAETDEFINGPKPLALFSVHLCRVATVVTSALAQFGVEPELEDFMAASFSLIEESRAKFDKALLLSDWKALKAAACELEVIWYGIAASLGLPYHELMQLLHDACVEGRELNFNHVLILLHRAGLPVELPAAANEPAA